jgi:pimeloyl-ACP methyl ester carboxylesterase
MKSPISILIYPGASRSITVEQVKSTLRPGEELIWRESIRNERIGLIVRPPSSGQGWIVFFYGNGMTLGGTAHIRQRLGNAGYGVVCVEYAGYGVSSGTPSEQGCYRAADAAITYLQREASATLDQVALVGWSLGSAVAMDQASRRTVRAQVLLSPLTSLFAATLDLAHLGRAAFSAGPFNSLSKAESVDCPTLIVSGTNDMLTRPWMANNLTKAMGRRARLVNLSGVGHNNMLIAGDRLWDIVIDFLKSPQGL